MKITKSELRQVIQEEVKRALEEDWVENKHSGAVYQVQHMDPSKHTKASRQDTKVAKKEVKGKKGKRKDVAYIGDVGAKELGGVELYKMAPKERRAEIEKNFDRMLSRTGDFVDADFAKQNRAKVVNAIAAKMDKEAEKNRESQ